MDGEGDRTKKGARTSKRCKVNVDDKKFYGRVSVAAGNALAAIAAARLKYSLLRKRIKVRGGRIELTPASITPYNLIHSGGFFRGRPLFYRYREVDARCN